MARFPGTLLCVVLLASVTAAQSQPTHKVQTGKAPSVSMPMVAPVFLEDAEFTSTVTLVNDAIQDFSARVLVLDSHGVVAAQKEFLLPGHTNLPIRIHDLLEESGSSAVTTGSVIVFPQPAPGMPIGGQLSITTRAGAIPSYIEEELLMPDEKTSPGMFRTAALAVKGSPIVALKSLAQTAQTITLECFSEKAAPTKGTVQLAAGESVLVAACDVSQTGRAAITEAMSGHPALDRGAVGVAITTTAPAGDLIGYGFAAYQDDRGPYFTSLNLTDPAAMASSNTIFTGIPAGPTDVLQRTSFKPELAVSNFSAKPAQVSVTLATTTAGKTKADVVQTLLLPPSSSKTVKVPAQGDPGMTNSLVVHSSLTPGEVVSQFVAWGDSLVRTVELQAKDNDSIQNGGGHPWSIENGANSTLLWFNHSTDGPKKFEILIGNGKQLWVNTYMLAPMETKAISINEIVEKQIPDKSGVVLSKDILSGQVGWWTHRAKWGKGRLMVSQPQSGLARSFSCGTCANLCARALISPDASATFPIGVTGDLGGVTFQQCLATCGQCGGTVQGPLDEFPTWSSSDTSIATVYSGLHSTTAAFKGVAAGSTNGNVRATDTGCSAQGSGSITVVQVQITSANLETNQVNVTISGPSGTSGTLEVIANGSTNNPQVTYNGGAAVGPGSYTVPLNRPSMPADTYSSVKAIWNYNPIPATTTFNLTRPWLVLGVIRHSQYNTPYESACTGPPQTAWVFTSNCSFTQVALKSDFVSQTYLNGSGASQGYGDLQFNNGSLCSGKYPNGANTQNSFLQVSSITGACGTPVVGGDSVATYPSPNVGNPYGCGDNIQLVTSSNANQALKHVADYCPACSSGFSGTNGHMDDYSSVQACSGGAVGDYGNFWTADTH